MALRGTLTHWKTRLLAQKLGVQPWAALGLLEALWHVTSELAPAGNIGRLPNQAIAMEMFYEGDSDALIEALKFSKHLDVHDIHRLVVHDWSQHSDYNTRRKVTRRGESMADGSAPRLVMTRHESIPEPVPVPEPEPVPEPVPKEKTLASTDKSVPADKGKLLGTLPLNDGTEWQVFAGDVDPLVPLYPAIDVRQELRSMKGWLIGNPKLRKTRRGIKRFISAWLEKEQDKARPGGLGNGANHRVPESKWEAARRRILEEPEMDQGAADDDGRATRGPNTLAGRPDGTGVGAEWLF